MNFLSRCKNILYAGNFFIYATSGVQYALAQKPSVSGTFGDLSFSFGGWAGEQSLQLIDRFIQILNALIPLIIGVALVGFLYGVAKFILCADDSSKREEGRQLMIWGVIGLFVMVSVWGIVNVVAQTFGIGASRSGLNLNLSL